MRRSDFSLQTTFFVGCLAAYVSTLGAGLQAGAAQATENTLDVYSGRPVKEAIAVLERRYGWIVTYEDPLYVYSGDLDDLTKVPTPDGRRSLSPKARRLELPQPLPAPSEHLDPMSLLDAVLEADSVGTGEKRFRVLLSDYGLHVIPTRSRNVAGVPTAVQPILDTRITLNGDGVSAHKLLEQFCAAISQATGATFVLATVPRNLLLTRTVTLSANNESARQVLIRVLQELGVPLTWRLLYSPSTPQGFALNIVPPG